MLNSNYSCTSQCSRESAECLNSCNCDESISLLLLNPNVDLQYRLGFTPGGDERVVNLEFDPSYSDRQAMCSFTLLGNMYLIGKILEIWILPKFALIRYSGGSDGDVRPGVSNERRQLKVTESGVEALMFLPFRFNHGLCVNYDDQHVLACAAQGDG